MAGALTEARELIGTIQDAFANDPANANLLYSNKLRKVDNQEREVVWIGRQADFGLAPLVSTSQNSPIIGQGKYYEFKSAPVDSRFVKEFTADELRNLVSPDERYRISAKYHLAAEIKDMMRRAAWTREYIAQCAVARGAVKFVDSSNPASKMNVSLTFPIPTKTAGVLWDAKTSDVFTADIPANLRAWVMEFELKNGKKPDAIRLTPNVWYYIRQNPKVQAAFKDYLRFNGGVPAGVLTPELIATSLELPPFEIYGERFGIEMSTVNAESAATGVVIEVNSTFGLNIGDKVLMGYNKADNSWTEEVLVTALVDGVSFTATFATASFAAGTLCVARPTFFPENRILLYCNEVANVEYRLCPFGISTNGNDITVENWRGIRSDAFEGGSEPNLRVFRRVWDSFGVTIYQPQAFMSAKVL